MNTDWLAEFQSPPALYRAKPFWAWNGKLETDELRRQIRLLRRMGFGGFFMHARVGLDTAYLSPEWFDSVATCVDEAKKIGLEAWLYDEDRWPSGAAGGLVTSDPRYRSRRLIMECLARGSKFKWDKSVLAVFIGTVEEATKTLRNVRRVLAGRPVKPAPGETAIVFRSQIEPCREWFNGYTYLDTLNPEAVAQYIRVTHESYLKRFGREFGGVVPGIFTDEPNFGFWRPWTDRFPQEFRRRFGYDLIDHLPEIGFRVEGRVVSRVRRDYTDCATHLFVNAFSKQIGQWCEKAGLLHTGHTLAEETPLAQAGWTGSVMRFYEYMHAPGIDLLAQNNRDYDSAKQMVSVARQFGRRWRLTETYGCTGWDFGFEGHKAIGDWQAALGINFRCPHLSFYTMEGEAKRDYPASIFYQSPWWDHYAKVEDYFARLNVALSRGRDVRDLLVVHPVESMWALPLTEGYSPERRDYNDVLWKFRDALLSAQLDFDYGDEDILSRHARIVKQAGRAVFRVGQADYKVVAVPPMLTMRRSTLDLLDAFRRAGGEVVFGGPPPANIDGDPAPDAAALADRCVRTPPRGPRLVAALERARRVSITGPGGAAIRPALFQLREDRDAWYLFVCNTGHDCFGRTIQDLRVARRTLVFPDVRIRVAIDAAGHPVELDPDTGRLSAADAVLNAGSWEIRTSLPRLGTRLFRIPKKAGRTVPAAPELRIAGSRALGGQAWAVSLSENNNLALDRPRYKIGTGGWQKADEILRVDRVVREALGLPPRGGTMRQPWAREKTAEPRTIPVALEYAFEVKNLPSGGLFLGLERPGTFRIALNGVSLDTDMECGWWVDRSLPKIPIDPAILRPGRNTLTLGVDYSENHPGLEIVYLLGDFGVRAKGSQAVMTVAPTRLRLGDWGPQGLAFYSGSVGYRTVIRPRVGKGQRLFVRVTGYRGAAVRVLVDGRQAGILAWEPNEVDITDYVASGTAATLVVEVLGHRRNSHGPLHYAVKWPSYIGPAHFVSKDGKWSDDYQLVPCGLMEPPRLILKEKR